MEIKQTLQICNMRCDDSDDGCFEFWVTTAATGASCIENVFLWIFLRGKSEAAPFICRPVENFFSSFDRNDPTSWHCTHQNAVEWSNQNDGLQSQTTSSNRNDVTLVIWCNCDIVVRVSCFVPRLRTLGSSACEGEVELPYLKWWTWLWVNLEGNGSYVGAFRWVGKPRNLPKIIRSKCRS